jgi:hypothetical protein
MARKCSTCQHIKRAEIDRRIAAGELSGQIARDYDLNPSSLHRHRTNCLKLSSSNAIMKEVSRGTVAVACLPSKDELNQPYFDPSVADRPDRHAGRGARFAPGCAVRPQLDPTLDSLSRLAGFDRQGSQVNVAVQTNINLNLTQIAERVISKFDHEPELKARIARALLEIDNEQFA